MMCCTVRFYAPEREREGCLMADGVENAKKSAEHCFVQNDDFSGFFSEKVFERYEKTSHI